MSQSREKLLHSLYLLKIFNKVVSLSIVAIIAKNILFDDDDDDDDDDGQ
jgi:hypothetical protein